MGRLFVPQLLLVNEGKVPHVIQAAKVIGLEPDGLEFFPVKGRILPTPLDLVKEAPVLQGMQFIAAEGFHIGVVERRLLPGQRRLLPRPL
jgi:hypothetical protein